MENLTPYGTLKMDLLRTFTNKVLAFAETQQGLDIFVIQDLSAEDKKAVEARISEVAPGTSYQITAQPV